jgi:hypothetical protein
MCPREVAVHTQQELIQICTPAATHDVIGQWFPLGAWGRVQDEGDQAVVRRAAGGATALEATVSLPPRLDVQIIGPRIHYRDSCIIRAFKACRPR